MPGHFFKKTGKLLPYTWPDVLSFSIPKVQIWKIVCKFILLNFCELLQYRYFSHGVGLFIGRTYIGLLQSCLEIYSGQQSEMCFTPVPQRTEWLLTFACIILGILSVTSTIGLLILSHWRYRVMKHARWLGFVASKYFSEVILKTWYIYIII